MSTSAAQADAFYIEVLREGQLLRGQRAMPFWSLRSRTERVIETVDACADFVRETISLDVWREHWLTGLDRDGVRLGLNWAGKRATGFDLPAADVIQNLSGRE